MIEAVYRCIQLRPLNEERTEVEVTFIPEVDARAGKVTFILMPDVAKQFAVHQLYTLSLQALPHPR